MDAQNISIRKARPDDAEALTKIIRSVDYFTHLIELPLEEARQLVARALEQDLAQDSAHLVLVAEDRQGQLLGYTTVHWLPYLILNGPEGYVSELFIYKGARGRGIGTLLIEAVKKEAQERGCSRLNLLNGRQRESYRREFYKKNGWRERDMASFVFDL
jgi:GNAT superfamily N-acetyltransferase